MANATATRKEAQEYVIDLILNYIITNANNDGVGIDLANYKRYVDPATGQITVGDNPNNSNLVLYQEDFRESYSSSPTLLNVVDNIIDYCITETSAGSEEYNLTTTVSDNWIYIPGGSDCTPGSDSSQYFKDQNFGGISINGVQNQDENGNTLLMSGCTESGQVPGSMGCIAGSTEQQILLPLTDDVLTSLSQFITITEKQTIINTNLADEVLDTNIYELLQTGLTRQEQINNFFATYNTLKGVEPDWEDVDGDGIEDPDQFDATAYATGHDATYAENDFTGFIPRLTNDEMDPGQSLEALRNDLDNFLKDVDYEETVDTTDTRTDYENQSGGYLKFRGLNQAILIRSTEGANVGLENYRVDGFTITMWVRFLDKVSSGTLFNYGNPLRSENPTGFMLETFMNDGDTDNRYIRLVLRDTDANGDGIDDLRDSRVGVVGTNRGDSANLNAIANHTVGYTQVPIDFSEWYFIVASFNPNILEDESHANYAGEGHNTIHFAPDGVTPLSQSPEFWRNNVNPGTVADDGTSTGTYTSLSNYGAKCKVEVISKSDLLRARGFKA